MDRAINKINEAFMAATRIVNMVESAGFNITDPLSIINYANCSNTPDEMRYSYGASRLVIWDDDYCDYVIKIALNESYEKYCQHEVDIYNAAVKEGFADKFAWCACYSEPCLDEDFYNPGIYVMEYVDCNEDEVYDSAWKYGYEEFCSMKGIDGSSYSDELIRSFDNWNCEEEEDMVIDYIKSSMSYEEQRAFNVFMMKWCISDIHTQNAGFIGNRMVMVDYAGWNW